MPAWPRDRWAIALGLVAPLALYLLVASRAITLPGLYMDAINPDYLAVRIAGDAAESSVFRMPGNLLFGRIPILAGSLYHGSLHAWITLPFYLALGGSVVSMRLDHIVLGSILLLAVVAATFRLTRSVPLATVTGCLLAIDPAYVFTFRTQAHITTFPAVFVIPAVLLLAAGSADWRRWAGAGVLFGLSAWGYFVYIFMWPGLAIFLLLERRSPRQIAALAAGVAAGLLPYAIGFALIFLSLGPIGGLNWFRTILFQLHIGTPEPYLDRVHFIAGQAWDAMTAAWHAGSFYGGDAPPWMQVCVLVTLGICVAGAPLARGNAPRERGFRLMGLLIASYLVVATAFGRRLGGHHFCLLTPLLAIEAALAFAMLRDRLTGAAWIGAALALLIAGVEVSGTRMIFAELRRTGGLGLYATTIGDYATRTAASADRTPRVFMSWGGLLPFIWLTGGRIPAYQAEDLPFLLCRQTSLKAVFLGEDAGKTGAQSLHDLGAPAALTAVVTDGTKSWQLAEFSIPPQAVLDASCR